MARNRIDTELETLMGMEFPDNLAAFIALQRFRMFAAATGYRNRVFYLTVKDKKIVREKSERKPKFDFLFRQTAAEPPRLPKEKLELPEKKPQIKADEEAAAKPKATKKSVAEEAKPKAAEKSAEGTRPKNSKKAKRPEEQEPKPTERKGGRKPRALKREEKKGKEKEPRSKSSKRFRH